ncbi:alpha/beta-hydrolase [Penicillium macrosclerotiorum]|uniref:alpha/beta-hydrolase n=1 Tax=Penicillium macrosclerotiorum TaxID=303699 RepID=UPI0025486A9A|nr:alpha/beta-hydrolase [Penicillium macrosclerotiorum]KAJ5689922.1 alpha/beta-hydrolase [Penicillium macrosclerotiorum]
MLAQTRPVILQDTRGEGRSPYANFVEFHYDDFTRDAIALLDHLNIARVAVLGWSDGAITGLNLAMKYSSRIDRVFAHGANLQANMSIPGSNDPIITSKTGSLDSDIATNGTTFSQNPKLQRRADCHHYACEDLSPLPDRCGAMVNGVNYMWKTEPAWDSKELAKIQCPVWIVDGDHDVAVKRNQADALAAWIPYAGELILPQVGHVALLQDPILFNFAVKYFMDMRFDGVFPIY